MLGSLRWDQRGIHGSHSNVRWNLLCSSFMICEQQQAFRPRSAKNSFCSTEKKIKWLQAFKASKGLSQTFLILCLEQKSEHQDMLHWDAVGPRAIKRQDWKRMQNSAPSLGIFLLLRVKHRGSQNKGILCWRLTNKQYETKSASSISVLRAIRQRWQVTRFIHPKVSLRCLWPRSLKPVAFFTSTCYIWRFSPPQLSTSGQKWPVLWSCLLLKWFRAFLRWARTWNPNVITAAW